MQEQSKKAKQDKLTADPDVVAVDKTGAPLPPNTSGTSDLAELAKKQRLEEAAAMKINVEKDETRAEKKFTEAQIQAAKEKYENTVKFMMSTGQIKTEADLPQLPKEMIEYKLPFDFRTGQPSASSQVTKMTPTTLSTAAPAEVPQGATRTKVGAKKTKVAPKKALPKPTGARGRGKGKAKADEGKDALEALDEEA